MLRAYDGLLGLGGGSAGGRGGGNLVGPDHPMFFPDYEGGGGAILVSPHGVVMGADLLRRL
jgi:hypothetical protein